MPLNDHPELVTALLRQESGARARVLDEHNFRIDLDGYEPGTLRLQLFTAPGLRLVAVATQGMHGESGQSLTNGAERYATAVWETFFAEHEQPPIWIERTLLDGVFADEFALVTFDVVDERALGRSDWETITPNSCGTWSTSRSTAAVASSTSR